MRNESINQALPLGAALLLSWVVALHALHFTPFEQPRAVASRKDQARLAQGYRVPTFEPLPEKRVKPLYFTAADVTPFAQAKEQRKRKR